MAENITGAIKALIGADTSDYKKAMAEVLSVTNSTMNKVVSNMSQSTNSIVSKVGSIMGQLSSTIPSKLAGLKTSMVAPFSTAGGQIQRVIASIGEKIPQPIKNGFNKVAKIAGDTSSLVAKGLNGIVKTATSIGTKIGSGLTNAFNKAGTKAASALNNMISKSNKVTDSTSGLIKKVIGIGAAYAIAQKGISIISGAITGLVSDLNQGSATWKTFNANMENIGMGKKEIAGVKKELQDFATKTIYSSSEMATTYSQLAAVGIKSADQLVKGFGGLAAAAENPTQAMKTLSQQATQMAAKPTVQWQDFKLMLEQTPAGIAAVSKQMGISTSEMVTAVQDGKIKTEDFFDAITKVGTNDTFSKMATEYKTVGQAMDGLKETLTNKLQPSFDKLSQVGINAISKITDKIDSFNMAPIEKAMDSVVAVLDHFVNGTKLSGDALKNMQSVISGILPVLGLLGGALTLSGALPVLASLTAGFIGFSGVLSGPLKSAFGLVSRNIIGLIGLFPKIGGGLSSAASVGMGALGGMTSAMATIMQVALAAVGPAAILGLVVAGLGLVNKQFGTQIDDLLKMVTTKGSEVISKFVQGITSQIPQLFTRGTQLISKLANTIATMLPVIVQAGVDIVGSLVGGVAQNLPSLISSALTIITTILTSLASALPQLIVMGMNLLLNLGNGLVTNIPQIVSSVQQILQVFVGNITANLPQIIQTGIQILLSLINGLTQLLPQLLPVALSTILTLIQGIMNSIPQLLSGAVQIVQALCNFIVQNLPMILQAAVQIIQALVSGLVQNLPNIISTGIQIVLSLVTTIIQMLPSILAAGWDIVKSLASGVIEAIPNVLKGAWDGIKNGFSNLWDTITGKSKEKSAEVTSTYSQTAESMKSKTGELSSSVSESFDQMGLNISNATSNISSSALGDFSSILSQGSSDAQALNANVTNATQALQQAGSSDIRQLSTSGSADFSSLLSSGTSSIQGLEKTVSGSMSGASSNVTNETNQMEKQVSASFRSMTTITQNNMNQLKSLVQSTMNQLQQTIVNGMNTIRNSFQSGMTQSIQVSTQASYQIVSVFSVLSSQLHIVGYNAGIGLANGLSSSAGAIYSTANTIANNVARTIQSALDIHSPSKITTWMGEMLGKGLGLGMQSMFSFVEKQANEFGSIIQAQRYQAEAVMVGDTTFTNKKFHAFTDEMDRDVTESELRQEEIHIYNEVIGDKIYTTVKREEAREKNKNDYFN